MTSINQEMINKANTKCDAYEAPHLTIIPLRTSGAMLVGSVLPLETFSKDESFRNYFQSSEDGGTVTDNFGTASGWDGSFWD